MAKAVTWWRAWAFWAVLAVLALPAEARSAAPSCVGDCGGDGQVVVTELVTCVNIALGSAAPDACAACDANGDGSVTINELIASVLNALGGCPTPLVTPTYRPTVTPTASPAATRSATVTPTATPSATRTSSPTVSSTANSTSSATLTRTATASPTLIITQIPTAPPTATATVSPTPTAISTSTATPTVTATADSERACGAIVLESQSGVTVSGSTANGVDHAGGASCGFSGGGNGAPDVVYEYVAPAAGIYDIRVQAASFAAYLYVRANTCAPSEPELGCTAGDGQTDPQVTLTLAQGQSVAIVVDGESPRGGTFTLNIKQRQPDLVVTDISAPTEVTAGEQIQLAAEVTNIGNDAAGPFTVLFLLARDAALTQPLGSRFAACTLDGLAPGQTQICQALTPLDVPLVTEGTYYVGASADARHEVKDANRDNNALASGVVLHTVGVQLVQQLFRAADGSAYQLVRALPTLTRTDQEEYRITTVVGARSNSVEACQVGEVVYASVAGASPALEVGGTRTKRVAPPNESVQWSPDGSGLLILGDGPAQLEVCARDGDCDGNQLLPGAGLLVGDDTIRQACFSQQTDSFCQGLGPDEVAFAFGLPPADFNECGDQPTRFRLPCDQAPDDGFSLRAGEAVVFVYRSAALDPVLGLRPDDPFSVGIAGFAIDRDGVNAVQCTSGGVIGSEVLVVQPTGIPTPSDTPTPGPSPTGPRATPTVA